MYRLTNLIKLLFLFVIFSELSFGQNTIQTYSKQKQSYNYEDNFIQLVFKTNKITYINDDTLFVMIQLMNTSKEPIYILKANYTIYNYTNSSKIIFKYGGDVTGCEYCENEMVEIKPNSDYISKHSLLIKDLIDKDYKGNVELFLDLGYVNNFDSSKFNSILRNKEIVGECYYKEGKLYMSSIAFDVIKSYINNPVLRIYIRD